MTDQPLSPAAAAVLDATWQEMDYAPRRHLQRAAAAALRAAAPMMECVQDHLKLLAIAAELGGQQ